MSISLLDLSRFTRRGAAAQAAVDRAIARADLVLEISARKRGLQAIRLQRDDDVTDAQLRLGMAEQALVEFDQQARAPYPTRHGSAE